MTHRMSRASSTVARALQMTAARAVSRGLETVDEIFTRFTLLVPESDSNRSVNPLQAWTPNASRHVQPCHIVTPHCHPTRSYPPQRCNLVTKQVYDLLLMLDHIHSYSWLCSACGWQARHTRVTWPMVTSCLHGYEVHGSLTESDRPCNHAHFS